MTVGILGLGLIGGSMARAYTQAGHTVLAWDADEAIVSFARLDGAVSDVLTARTLPQCDLVLLAIYPAGCIAWLEENAACISPQALVMDLCGIKREICSRCFPLARQFGFTFIGGHPMAGDHHSGFKYSRADLFRGAPMVLVPPRFDDMALLYRAKEALAPCGFGRFCAVSALDHDKKIAFTSQMPHILSNAFIQSPTARDRQGVSAGSYRDLTRVAWLNAGMWAELCMENRDFVLEELDTYLTNLQAYRDALAGADTPALMALLERGKKCKEEADG